MPKNPSARAFLFSAVLLAIAFGVFITVRAITSTSTAAGWVIHTADVLARIDDLDTIADYPGAARGKLEEIRALTLDNETQQANIKTLAATQMAPTDIHSGITAMRSEERGLLLKRIDAWYGQLVFVRIILIVLMVGIMSLTAGLVMLIRRQERIEQQHIAEVRDDLNSSVTILSTESPDIIAITRQLERIGKKLERQASGK